MATTCFVLKVFWNLFISVSFYVFSMSLAYIMSTEFWFFMCSQNNENIILNHSVIKKKRTMCCMSCFLCILSACTKCFDKYMFMLWHTVYSQEISIPTLIWRLRRTKSYIFPTVKWSKPLVFFFKKLSKTVEHSKQMSNLLISRGFIYFWWQ